MQQEINLNVKNLEHVIGQCINNNMADKLSVGITGSENDSDVLRVDLSPSFEQL